MTVVISNRQARLHLMHVAGFCDRPKSSTPRQDSLLADVLRLGFVQVDSVNVLERAHHHILFSRNHTYQLRDLAVSLEKDRTLFENWTHDASVIPTAFFPYWRHRFDREKQRLRNRWKGQFSSEKFNDDIARVHELIALDGPKMARDFEGKKASTGWWDWHPSKAALEYLWRIGDLCITRREGFQKVYDLTENVIPQQFYQQEVEHSAFVDWACRQALHRLGYATRGEIAAFWAILSPAEVSDWIGRTQKELVPVLVQGANAERPRPAFALPRSLEILEKQTDQPDRVRILSPFDPLLRDRTRAERIFGFSYRIEIFVPEAKRQYGYYVYPVFRGENAIGRIDAKADRERKAIFVRALWLEPGVRKSKVLLSKLEAELERLRRFTGMDSVIFADDWLRE